MFRIILLLFTVASLSGCLVTTKTYNKALDETRQITLERNALDKKATEYAENLAQFKTEVKSLSKEKSTLEENLNTVKMELKQCSEENTKLQKRVAEVDRIEDELKVLKQKIDNIKSKAKDIIDTINKD